MMRRLVTVLAVLAIALSTGCQKEDKNNADSKGSGEGINIEFPGGGVKVGEDGVEVKAPNTDVKVDTKKGVDVKAPGVGVKVDTQ